MEGHAPVHNLQLTLRALGALWRLDDLDRYLARYDPRTLAASFDRLVGCWSQAAAATYADVAARYGVAEPDIRAAGTALHKEARAHPRTPLVKPGEAVRKRRRASRRPIDSRAVPQNRMNREEFYARLAALDEERLKKALWNLYWRGTATLRERIEEETSALPAARHAESASQHLDPEQVLEKVRAFTGLARAGAYMAGDRRVSRTERSRWRFTFRALADEARRALAAERSGPAEEAVADLVDLACAAKDAEYFHSDDPVEAARFVVSEAAAALWSTLMSRHGLDEFAGRAMPQLIRWESEYGWTRGGYGTVSEKETLLADVLARMLPNPDAWVTCADSYLDALDRLAAGAPGNPSQGILYGSGSGFDPDDYRRSRRTANLSAWHGLLLERLPDYDAADRLDRLAAHPALGGAELLLLRARRARQTGALDLARALTTEALDQLPRHQELHTFAAEIGADLPERAQRVLATRRI